MSESRLSEEKWWEEVNETFSISGLWALRCPPAFYSGRESGGHSTVAPPVPIPNTEVKRCSADGSAVQSV